MVCVFIVCKVRVCYWEMRGEKNPLTCKGGGVVKRVLGLNDRQSDMMFSIFTWPRRAKCKEYDGGFLPVAYGHL